MYEVSTTQFDNKFRRVDLDAVRIDGRLAREMPLAELHAAVKRLGVPRVRPDMGAQDVILRIGVHEIEQQERLDEAARQ